MEREYAPGAGTELVVLMPLFNDWSAASVLMEHLDAALLGAGLHAEVLIVDDGSTVDPAPELWERDHRALQRIEVLSLRRNLGHQRAIAIGLAYIEDRIPCDAVVVMDSDGEDRPGDVPRLIDRYVQERGKKIVFAERTRRSEGLVFRVFYAAYKAIHFALTGYRVRVGNFSVIPRARLASLVVVSELWNHFAAATFRSGQPCCMVPTTRARRIDGRSKMNFVGLVTHGLSAMSVNSEVIGTRLLMVSFAAIVFALAGIALTVAVRIATNLAIPGWATYTAGILVVLLMLSVLLALIFSFVVLSGRSGLTFLPRRDYAYFIGPVTVLYMNRCLT